MTDDTKTFSLRLPLPKTEKGLTILRKIKLTLKLLIIFGMVLTGFALILYFPGSFLELVLTTLFIGIGFFLLGNLIEKIGNLNPISEYSFDEYIYLCEKYPELLAYHRTLNREPVRTELEAFQDFEKQVLKNEKKAIYDTEYKEFKRKLEALKTSEVEPKIEITQEQLDEHVRNFGRPGYGKGKSRLPE